MGGEEYDGEKPIHEVYPDAYYIARCSVTNADYKRYMQEVGQPWETPTGMADHLVVNVFWYGARHYTVWTGMRLPTEAEWEKAASWEPMTRGRGDRETRGIVGRIGAALRGDAAPLGRKRAYPWGDEFDKNRCNTLESGIGTTTPVGQYSPEGDSPYGCADMAGNVWEWTSSLKRSYPYRADDGREDPTASGSRVLRGGSFSDGAWSARCACRSAIRPIDDWDDDGFRVGCGALHTPLGRRWRGRYGPVAQARNAPRSRTRRRG